MMSHKELRLLLSQHGFDSLLRGYPDPVFVYDTAGDFVESNRSFIEADGYSRAELLTLPFASMAPDSESERATAEFAAAASGESRRYTGSRLKKDGSHYPVGVVLFPFLHEGTTRAVIGFSRDIAEEAALRAAQERSDAALSMAGRLSKFVGWTLDLANRDVHWTSGIFDLLGFPPDQPPPPEEAAQLMSKADVAELTASAEACEKEGIPFDTVHRIRSASGKLLHIRTTGEAVRDEDGTIIRLQGAFHDVTDVLEAEAARHEVEERLAKTMSSISDGIVILDEEWVFRYVNPRAEQILHKREDELVGNGMWDVFPEGRGTEFAIGYRRAIAENQAVVTRDYYEPLDCWLDVTAYPLDDGLAIYFRDVTAQERSQQLIRESEERIAEQAALLDVARDAIIVLRLDSTIEYWNRAATSLYGWTADEAIGGSILERVEGSPFVKEAIQTAIRTGSWSGEMEQSTRSGERIVAECSWTLIRDKNGIPTKILAVNSDITMRKKQDERFLRIQRMESLGTLAGGIAHDLNNVLTPLLMSVQMLARSEEDAGRMQLLQVMESSIKRGADMIRQVLSFARGVEGRRIEVNVNTLLSDLFAFCQEALPSNVTVIANVADDLSYTRGDPTQLSQVLINLVVNAKDAMPDGGELVISARDVELHDTYSSVSHLALPGRYVLIEVRDNGTGMSADILGKIFEPFFTTKEVGQGTGLGLATSIAIVRGHGGYFQAYSEPGVGSRFQVHLPAIPAHGGVETLAAPALGIDDLPRGNGERILVVDDEATIRQITRQTLEAFGYLTAVASNGAEAIEVIESGAERIDLVLTDMMMPVMDGATAAAHLLHRHPGLAVIAASGLDANGGVSRAADAGVRYFVAKPFTTEQLLTTIRDALAGD